MRSFAMRRCRCLAAVVSVALAVVSFALTGPPARAQAPQAQPQPPASPPPVVASSALLIVEPLSLDAAAATAAPAETEAAFQRRLNTHVAALRSEHVMRRVLTNINAETRKTRWFTGADNPLERATWLRDHVRVAAVPGTALIEVSLEDVRDPMERATILREICTVYLDNARQARTEQLLDRTSTLNNVKIKTDSRLKDLLSEMREKQIRINTEGGGIGRLGAKELELSKLVAELVDAQLRAGRAYAAFEAMKAAMQSGQAPHAAAVPAADADRLSALVRRLDDAEVRLAVAEARAADKAAKTPPDPAAADLRVEVAHVQKKVDALRAEAPARARVAALEDAQLQLAEANTALESLSKRVDFLKADLGELTNSMVAYASLQQEEKGLREQLKAVREQIGQVMSLQSSAAASGIRWHTMPEVTVRP